MKFYNRKGILYADFMRNGVRVRKSLNCDYTTSNIKAWKARLEHEHLTQGANFSVYRDKVLKYAKANLKFQTYRNYQATFNKISLDFKLNKLDKILPSHIESVIAKWQMQGLKASTISRYLQLLSKVFDLALRDDKITRNPVKLATKPKIIKAEKVAFNADETRLILANAKGYLKTFLYFAFYTGARAGEILGLKWRDIDFKDGFINITKTRIYGGSFNSPKSGKSRKIYLLKPLAQYLQGFLNKNDDSFIISRDINAVRYRFKALLSELNLPNAGLHSTRHSFIRQMLKNGVEMDLIAFMVGHSDLTMISKIYHGLLRDGSERIKLENALNFKLA